VTREYSMRRAIVRALAELGAFPVENSVHAGTPDVAFAGGWIELKRLEAWPKRPTTIVKPGLSPKQRQWLARHAKAGGQGFVLLRVGAAWLLFLATDAVKILDSTTRLELEQWAQGQWHGRGAAAGIRDWFLARFNRQSASL